MRVTLSWPDGDRRATIHADPDETILDAAEVADVALPFGCRRGSCATCTGRLRSGEVVHRRAPLALKDRHLDAGYVLLCIAEPRTDCRIDVGADIQTELVSNPWR